MIRRTRLRSDGRRRSRFAAIFVLVLGTALLDAGYGTAGAADAGRIRIEVDGVEREVADNIRAFLTLTRYLDREDVTDAQVRRLADRAVDEAADAMRPFGYYEPVIRSRTSRDDTRWIVRLRVKPGEPV
jgi:translocation and assembly module TamA